VRLVYCLEWDIRFHNILRVAFVMIDSYYGLNGTISTVHPTGSAPEPTLTVGTGALFHRKGKLVGDKHAAVLLAVRGEWEQACILGFRAF
jgi:hypothetical protein